MKKWKKNAPIDLTTDEGLARAINGFWTEIAARSETAKNGKEQKKWKENKILYGSDVPGTLFPENLTEWNLNKLTKNESYIHALPEGEWLAPLHKSFLYIGSRYSCFAMHAENKYVAAASYNHSGAPKVWYGIHRKDEKKIMALANGSVENNDCDNLLYHKCTVDLVSVFPTKKYHPGTLGF